MCVSDWRLGRLIRSAGRTVNIPMGGTVDIAADSQRVAIIIAATLTDITAGQISISANGVVFCYTLPFSQPAVISLVHYGDLPTKKLTLASSNGGADELAHVTEFWLSEAILHESLDQLKRG